MARKVNRRRTPRDFVNSLARGLAVISAFGPDARQLTLSEVAHRTGLDRATARRILLTLKSLGYVSSDDGHFQLTPKVLSLAQAYLASTGLADVALPIMEGIRDTIQESCLLAVLDKTDVVCVAYVDSGRTLTIRLSVGERRRAYCAATGRVLLAALPGERLEAYFAEANLVRYTAKTVADKEKLKRILNEVRRKGYCLVDGEVEEGLRTIAVPVTNRFGTVIATLGASSHAGRISRDAMVRVYLPLLREAADRISLAYQ